LFAPGAGAPSTSAWMTRMAEQLSRLGTVRRFDYPYMRGASRRKAPDRLETLVAAHRAELSALVGEGSASGPVIVAGKSMGGRIGCHVAVECARDSATAPQAVVCFGYPLRGQNGKLRDEVLLALTTPILFVQGTRDELCALSELEQVRKRMKAPSELYVVDEGDHSLELTKTTLKARGITQADVERDIVAAVERFCRAL
jgi:predicted alpha/beta-hydrolase family hydrolase